MKNKYKNSLDGWCNLPFIMSTKLAHGKGVEWHS